MLTHISHAFKAILFICVGSFFILWAIVFAPFLAGIFVGAAFYRCCLDIVHWIHSGRR